MSSSTMRTSRQSSGNDPSVRIDARRQCGRKISSGKQAVAELDAVAPAGFKAGKLPRSGESDRRAAASGAAAADEVVKHMSNVPPYLLRSERGDCARGKALSFGVLEWRNLERWMSRRSQATYSEATPAFANGLPPAAAAPSNSSRSRIVFTEGSSRCSGGLLGVGATVEAAESSVHQARRPAKNTVAAVSSNSTRSRSKGVAFTEDSSRCSGELLRGGATVEVAKSHLHPVRRPAKNTVAEMEEEEASDCIDNGVEFEGIIPGHQGLVIPHSCPILQTDDDAGSHWREDARGSGDGKHSAVLSRSLSQTEETSDVRRENSAVTGQDQDDREKKTAGGKGRKSPLRRMLDPLLKPIRKLHTSALAESPRLKKLSTRFVGSALSRTALADKGAGLPSKSGDKLHCSGQQMHEHDKNQQLGRDLSSKPTRHAMLKIASKNGLPLFILSSRDSDILAATARMKNNSDGADHVDCIYSIFKVQEPKRKSGSWIKPASGGDGSRQLVSNIVSEMRVSSRKQPSADSSSGETARQFVLVGKGLELELGETSNLQFKSELAAIIQEEAAAMVDAGTSITRTVAILPREIHGMSVSGKPTPLIERWKSGGACDCGGWDEGCALTVLADSHRHQSTNQPHRIELFAQGQDQEVRRAAFSMVAVKEGVYRVEFAASVFVVQAFATCVAMLHGTVHREAVGGGVKKKSLAAAASRSGTPRSYTPSYRPPLSPVGRA